jgi:hypothetical protein
MMRVLRDIGGIEMPDSLIRFTDDANGAPTDKSAPQAGVQGNNHPAG